MPGLQNQRCSVHSLGHSRFERRGYGSIVGRTDEPCGNVLPCNMSYVRAEGGNTREAAIRPNNMTLNSAEFPFLIPALAVAWQNCFQMSVSMIQCGQRMRVLPLLGNMESRLESNEKCI